MKHTRSRRRNRKPGNFWFSNQKITPIALALRAAQDDPERQGAFYSAMRPMVMAAVNAFATRSDAASKEDLTQDALLHMMRKIGLFNQKRGGLHQWATRIVRNIITDYYRKKFHQSLPLEDGHKEVADDEPEENPLGGAFTEVRSFFPFYVSSRVFYDLYEAVEINEFKENPKLTRAIEYTLSKNSVDYKKHATISEITQTLLVLCRAWMLQMSPAMDGPLQKAVDESKRYDLVRVLRHYLGTKPTAILLCLFGGITVKLPTPRQVMRVGKGRRLRSR